MRLIDADALIAEYPDDVLTHCDIEAAPTIDLESLQPQWIPVTERLPECGEHYESNDVLVSVDYRPDDPEETKDTFVSIDHVCFNCFEQGEFSIERDNPYDTEPSPYFVTHWMPLPESYTLADVKGDDNAQRVKPVEFDRFKNDTLKDVQPVVHGKWEPVRYTTHCSCGKSYETYHFLCTACNHVAYAQPYGLKYCPNCGAKMDKEVNDDD